MMARVVSVAVLAWRSIWRHRRRTIITIASIAFGVTIVVFAVTMNEGVYSQLIDDAVRMQSGHVTIEHADYRDAPAIDLAVDGVHELRATIEALPGVEATKLLVLGQGIARSGSGAVGVAVMGVEPEVEARTSPLARNIVAGAYLTADDGARVVVGRGLADRLRLDEGKKLVVATNDARGDLVESLYRVSGIFETGADEIDGYVIQAPLGPVRELYGLRGDQATQLGVLLDDPDEQRALLDAVSDAIAGTSAVARGWQQVLPELSAMIRLDRVSDWTFEGMLIVLVLFTILNTLLMSVIERERELSVLLAIGTPPLQLRMQVLTEAVYIGLIGSVVGMALGTAVATWFAVNGLDLRGLYDEEMTISGLAVSMVLRPRVTPEIVMTIGMIVFAATTMLGALVMRRASRIEIADVLR